MRSRDSERKDHRHLRGVNGGFGADTLASFGRGSRVCVDSAAANGLQFVELDAGWYGPEGDVKSDARSVSKPGIDLPAVIAYSNERGISVILYVNRRALETDLDELLPPTQEWGIAGIK